MKKKQCAAENRSRAPHAQSAIAPPPKKVAVEAALLVPERFDRIEPGRVARGDHSSWLHCHEALISTSRSAWIAAFSDGRPFRWIECLAA